MFPKFLFPSEFRLSAYALDTDTDVDIHVWIFVIEIFMKPRMKSRTLYHLHVMLHRVIKLNCISMCTPRQDIERNTPSER